MSGTLYVVATPIGHLGDLSQRAVATLKQVQVIAAEDTRRSGVLLAHIGHAGCQMVSLHDHNETAASPKLIARLQGATQSPWSVTLVRRLSMILATGYCNWHGNTTSKLCRFLAPVR